MTKSYDEDEVKKQKDYEKKQLKEYKKHAQNDVKNIKKELKLFVKELKYFQKKSKQDYKLGVELAQKLLKKVETLKVHPLIFKDKKKLSEFSRTKEALLLYISQIRNIQQFNKKWKKE